MVVFRGIDFANRGAGGPIAGILAGVLGLGIVVVVLLVSLGLALLLLPVLAVAVLFGRWRWRKLVRTEEQGSRPADGEGPVIELDYEVVEKRRP